MLHHTISACIWNRKHRYNETLIYILIIHSCIDIYLTYIIRVYLLTYILYARIYRIYLLFHHISSKRKRNVITIVIIIISYFVFYSVYLSYIIFIRRKEVILDTALLISRRITTVILNVFLDSNSFNFLAMHIKVHKLITIQNCHSLSYHTTVTYEYTNPGFVYHLKKSAWDLVYPADFWNTREIREIWKFLKTPGLVYWIPVSQSNSYVFILRWTFKSFSKIQNMHIREIIFLIYSIIQILN